MTKLKIADVPTFLNWIENGTSLDDNSLCDYINSLQNGIIDLVVIQEDFAPGKGEDPSESYTAINTCVRTMGLILKDLKSIRREVKTAKLLKE